ALRDETGDPWDGRSLEWSTSSPPPVFNYAHLPHVEDEEPYWSIKQRAVEEQSAQPEEEGYAPIEMPRNSPTGFVTAFFATLIGFALIWHIWWLAIVGFIGAYATFVVFAWRDHSDYEISA
ncbi:cytochrome o ubiquinol oxidase subunit I, partial [bacterium M00.F.Ca.ET.177.01.1.1]